MEEDSDSSPDEYYYYNDDDDDDDEDYGFWDGVTKTGPYYGFRPSFLPSYAQDYKVDIKDLSNLSITKEQAEKNAEELLEEEKREKEKADKKRLKKKRQKDRKREQRQKEVENLAPVDGTRAADSVAEDIVQDDFGEIENEDDLDLGSSFVLQAQKKMENKPKPERRERNKEIVRERERDKSQDSVPEKSEPQLEKKAACPPAAQRSGHTEDQDKVEKSLELAIIGNKLAGGERYVEALHYFTEAIKLNPGEFRFLGNRSYSYEHVGRFKEALQDAEKALELQPHFIKGHFRKGKALKGLKRYPEAIAAFQQVLSHGMDCTEAAQEIADCQQKLQEQSGILPLYTLPGLQPTPPSLLGLNNNKVFIPRNLVYRRSNGAQSVPCALPAAKPVSSTLYPVWVGNITNRITEDVLRSQFGEFGTIHSLRILYSRTCAFINFTSKVAAEAAFHALQGLIIEGTTLVLQLRNPEHSHLNPGGNGAGKAVK